MKKVISLVLAVVLAMSMATVAFAAVNESPKAIEPGKDITFEANQFSGKYIRTDNKSEATEVVKDSAYFSEDYFKIDTLKYKTGANLVEKAKFDDGKFVITLKKNYSLELKSIANFEIEKIVVKTIKAYKEVPKYAEFTLTGAQTIYSVGFDLKATSHTIKIGDGSTSLTGDGYFKFEKGSKSADDFTFDAGDVSLEFRAVEDEKLFLRVNNDYNKDLGRANPEAELDFFNFEGNTTVNNGRLTLSVDKDSFVYELKDGKLVKTSLKWSDNDYGFTGKVSTLGSYVVSDKELKDVPAKADDKAKNPNTGANDVVGVAVALAVVSLVAAGAVSLKK